MIESASIAVLAAELHGPWAACFM